MSELKQMKINGKDATVAFLTELGGELVEPSEAQLVVARFADGSMSYFTRAEPVEDPRSLGGKGSGNFGHAGRPGKVGGSSGSGLTRDSNGDYWQSGVSSTKDVSGYVDTVRNEVEDNLSGGSYSVQQQILDDNPDDAGIDTIVADLIENGSYSPAQYLYELIPKGRNRRALYETALDALRERLTKELRGYRDDMSEMRGAGGKGSGNFGHAGRPGKEGGSAPKGGFSSKVKDAPSPQFESQVPVYAERDGKRKIVGHASSFDEAQGVIKKLEQEDKWPEGYDAVVEPGNGLKFMFTDQWDNISDQSVKDAWMSVRLKSPGKKDDRDEFFDSKGVMHSTPKPKFEVQSYDPKNTAQNLKNAGVLLQGKRVSFNNDAVSGDSSVDPKQSGIFSGFDSETGMARLKQSHPKGGKGHRYVLVDPMEIPALRKILKPGKLRGAEEFDEADFVIDDSDEELRDAGGPGSGNFGHAGRPGKEGGSASGSGRALPKGGGGDTRGDAASRKILDGAEGEFKTFVPGVVDLGFRGRSSDGEVTMEGVIPAENFKAGGKTKVIAGLKDAGFIRTGNNDEYQSFQRGNRQVIIETHPSGTGGGATFGYSVTFRTKLESKPKFEVESYGPGGPSKSQMKKNAKIMRGAEDADDEEGDVNDSGVEELRDAGGPGSGNFGHAGRPGKEGGSAPSGPGESISDEDRHGPSRGEVIVGDMRTKGWVDEGGFNHTGIHWKQEVDADGRPIPIKVGSVEDAVLLVLDGKVVEVADAQAAHTLITKLGDMAKEAKAKGEAAPEFDLCQVSVPGSNMFCAQSLRTKEFPNGVPRLEMPQLGGQPVPGSEADKLPRNPWDPTEVDGASAFVTHLQGIGVKTSTEILPAANLRASQQELVGTKVAKMMADTSFDPAKNPIFVSSDNYVVDGHHRWAAVIGRDAADNKLGDISMNVIRVNAPISEVLHLANAWSRKFGIKQAAGVVRQSKATGLQKGKP